MRRYHIQNREDYASYNRLCGSIRQLVHKLRQLPAEDSYRMATEGSLLSKLFDMAILDASATSLDQLEQKITVSAMCRRRLGVVLCKLKMCQTTKMAVQFIEQGHIRVGPDVITDPAFLVTRCAFKESDRLQARLTRKCRHMEDFVTWVCAMMVASAHFSR